MSRLRPRLAGALLALAALTGPAAPALAQAAPVAGFPDPPPYEQHMESDCEAAAASLAFSLIGMDVSEGQIMSMLPMDSRPPEMRNGAVVRWGSPDLEFVGDPNGWLPWLPGAAAYGYAYGVYADPLAQALAPLDSQISGGRHITSDQLKAALADARPVVVWLPDQTFFRTERIGPMQGSWTTWDGGTAQFAYREHAQVLLSYGPSGYRLANIGYEQSRSRFINVWSDAEFERGYALLDDMALIL
ncbi:MAG: C39 family peptidase [Chloroflexi bacterium]|nr:C39 family peptidase [Chloroflexota bacterium]